MISYRPSGASRVSRLLTVPLVAFALLGSATSAFAGPSDVGDPVGAPYTIDINQNAQNAIVAGTGAAATGITCAASGGTACAATGVLVAFVTPFVKDAGVCPNNGTRRLTVQDEQTVDSGTGGNTTQPYVTGNSCI